MSETDSIKHWDNLFNFGTYILAKPKRGGKNRNMSNLIGKKLSCFPQSLLDEKTNATFSGHIAKSPKDPMKFLASAVAAKIEDGNI